MEAEKCALVITSSVYVHAPYTVLTDPGQRECQYLDAIVYFLQKSPFRKIVVCDNSGYHYPHRLHAEAAACGKQLELLSFRGNHTLVSRYGKGYGEGEIMKHVMTNSLLIREVEGILKITGRLRLLNAAALLRRLQGEERYFMPVSLLRPRWLVPAAARPCVDTRVYYTPITFFRQVLLDAYTNVRDPEVYFLEHAYHDALAACGRRIRCFPVAPEFSGVSGSNGWVFRERSGFKKGLLRLARLLGYIRPVYRRAGRPAHSQTGA